MAVYRFRVTFEEQDDVIREIDIRSVQTFRDLHQAILEAVLFDQKHSASFYISDDYWRKGQEIALKPGETADPKKKQGEPKLMEKCKLAPFIEDPHQKFIYVYDYDVEWTFLVELTKILNEDPNAAYPKCTKVVGIAPRQYKQVLPPPDAELDDEDATPVKEKVFLAEQTYDPDEPTAGDLTSEEGEPDLETGRDPEEPESNESESEEDSFGQSEFMDEEH